MNAVWSVLFLSAFVVGSQAIRNIRRDVQKVAHFCSHICGSCDGVGVLENDVCLCYVKDHDEAENCLVAAKRKADFFGIDWNSVRDAERGAKKTRPIRGSFLDPIVANVFEDSTSGDEFDVLNFNTMRLNPRRLTKRSLNDGNVNVQNILSPTEMAKQKSRKSSKVAVEPASQGPSTIKRRIKRKPRSIMALPEAQASVYQFAVAPETGKTVQLQIPYYDDGLEIEHEYYYVDDDDSDLYGTGCQGMSNFDGQQWNNQLYENREIRSPWLPVYYNNNNNYPPPMYF